LKAYGPKQPPSAILQRYFSSVEEADTFIAAAGFTFKTDHRGVILRHREKDWQESLKAWKGEKVVVRRGTRAWVVKNGM
jgi:hypothetical protein